MTTMLKRFVSLMLVVMFSVVISIPTFAEKRSETNDLSTYTGFSSTQIEMLSKKYKVDANELKSAIEKSETSEVFSPFSQVQVNDNVEPSESENDVSTQKNRFLGEFTVKTVYTKSNQNSTAYLATGQNTASGKVPAVGMCAVHHYQNGKPYIPFHTQITYTKSVSIQGRSRNAFTVEDTGDRHFKQSTYWTDLFFGSNTRSNRRAALNYGNRKVTYTYTL